MTANTKIEWCDHTFNPWVGCTKISPACDHCYAEAWAMRTGHPELWQGARRRTKTWNDPLKWHRAHEAFFAAHGRRQRVFCASLADVFDNQIPAEWRAELWSLVRKTPNLDWLLLTKRPQNIARMLPDDWGRGYPNVWLGVTAENQEEADRRVPVLLDTPAAVRFLSCEPLLGPIDLTYLPGHRFPTLHSYDALNGREIHHDDYDLCTRIEGLDWVIAGGESGPNARPMHPDWAQSLRDQCAAEGAPFFFKQWGGARPKSGGRVLDDRVHDAFPEAAR